MKAYSCSFGWYKVLVLQTLKQCVQVPVIFVSTVLRCKLSWGQTFSKSEIITAKLNLSQQYIATLISQKETSLLCVVSFEMLQAAGVELRLREILSSNMTGLNKEDDAEECMLHANPKCSKKTLTSIAVSLHQYTQLQRFYPMPSCHSESHNALRWHPNPTPIHPNPMLPSPSTLAISHLYLVNLKQFIHPPCYSYSHKSCHPWDKPAFPQWCSAQQQRWCKHQN